MVKASKINPSKQILGNKSAIKLVWTQMVMHDFIVEFIDFIDAFIVVQ